MSRKPRPILQDMPYLVKQKIAGKLMLYTDKMALRAFNPEFRQIIGDPEAIQDLVFCWNSDSIYLTVRLKGVFRELLYKQTHLGCLIIRGWTSQAPRHLIKDRDHAQVALEDFKAFTENPNLTVNMFSLTIGKNHAILFERIPGKLRVKKFMVHYSGLQEEILPVFARLDSNFLKILKLYVFELKEPTGEKMEYGELVKLDQWKHLEDLCLCKIMSPIIPMEHWWNIPTVSFTLTSTDQLAPLLDHYANYPIVKHCEMRASISLSEIKKAIGEDLPWTVSNSVVYPAMNGQDSFFISLCSEKPLLKGR